MSMNIKNEEAHAMATELARLRRVSVTKAVSDAVRAELDRERARNRKEKLADRLLKIGQRCAAHMRGPHTSQDHGDLLYDERGLPR